MRLVELKSEDVGLFKKYLQEAFQHAYESIYGKSEELVLPEEDIDKSLDNEGCHAYEAVGEDGEILGGIIVNIDEKTKHNHLDFLFVRVGVQSKGIGQAIWDEIEDKFPDAEIWETCTPYFDKRNIHFYVNKLGFHIVEYYHEGHQDPNDPIDNFSLNEGMFRFEKKLR